MSGAPADANLLAPFWRSLAAWPTPFFVVMDGAQFLDLASKLSLVELKRRSLFLDQADAEVRRLGPWLVEIEQPHDLRRLAAITGERMAVVAWACPAGVGRLYNHLRHINQAIVARLTPQGRARQREAELMGDPVEDLRDDYRFQRVAFRHFDPRALAQTLPALTPEQIAKLLGPAECIALPQEFGGEPIFVQADSEAVAPHGPLCLDIAQMQAVRERRTERSRYRIQRYLYKAAPTQYASYGHDGIRELIAYAEKTARAYNVRSELARGLWAYMLLTSIQDFTQDWTIKRVMDADDPMTPDERVEKLFDARMAATSRSG